MEQSNIVGCSRLFQHIIKYKQLQYYVTQYVFQIRVYICLEETTMDQKYTKKNEMNPVLGIWNSEYNLVNTFFFESEVFSFLSYRHFVVCLLITGQGIKSSTIYIYIIKHPLSNIHRQYLIQIAPFKNVHVLLLT